MVDTKYFNVRLQQGHSYAGVSEGGIATVTEPIARTLIASGVAKAIDRLPRMPKMSKPGTKAVRDGVVVTKEV